jgi:hypothetical protein
VFSGLPDPGQGDHRTVEKALCLVHAPWYLSNTDPSFADMLTTPVSGVVGTKNLAAHQTRATASLGDHNQRVITADFDVDAFLAQPLTARVATNGPTVAAHLVFVGRPSILDPDRVPGPSFLAESRQTLS